MKGHDVSPRLSKFSESKLASLVESYLDIARNRPFVIPASLGATDIYPDSRATPMPLSIIKQLAIYAGKTYIHDPLLDLAYEWRQLDYTMPLLVKYKTRSERVAYFRENLRSVLEELILLEPLIEAGVVHLTPTELIRPQKEPGAMYLDDFIGPGNLREDPLGPRKTTEDFPPQIKEYCDRSLVVWPTAYVNGIPTVLESEPLAPRNMISIGFSNDPGAYKHYQLFDIRPSGEASQDSSSLRHIKMNFDLEHKEPVDPSMFKNWVEVKRYEVASEIIDRLQEDLVLASFARAKFVTDLGSSRDLACTSFDRGSLSTSDKVVTALLKFDLPYFDNADFASIAKARQNEVAFEEFRSAMNKAFKEIEATPQSAKFQDRVTEVYHDLLTSPLTKIDQEMKVLKRNLFLDSVILLGSLGATFVTQGNTILTAATIYAATKVAETYKLEKAEEDKVKQLPSFFYWELTRK